MPNGPLIWAGGGCREADLSTELLELAQAVNAPVITTPQGKGAVPEDHPLSLGAYYYGHGPGHLALPRADVILAVGSRLHFTPNLSWDPQPHQKVIQIDADPEEVGRNLPMAVGIAADGRLGLQALLNELGGKTRTSRWTEGEVSAIRQQSYREIQEMAPLGTEIVETLRRELDDDAILVSGTTLVGYWSHLAFPVLKPRSYITSGYFATLGYAFPTALGAKVGNPHRQVVATTGDGGFGYSPAELATAVQEEINVVTIVFTDIPQIETTFPGYSSRRDGANYNLAFQGRQMRPDSLKFLISWTNHRPAKRKISKPLVYDQVSSLGSPFALYDPVTVINPTLLKWTSQEPA